MTGQLLAAVPVPLLAVLVILVAVKRSRAALLRGARWLAASLPWFRRARLWWWRTWGVPVRRQGRRLTLAEFGAVCVLEKAMRDKAGTREVAALEWAAEAIMREVNR